MSDDLLELQLRGEPHRSGEYLVFSWRGITAERYSFPAQAAFDYRWCSDRNYLALHNLKLIDGEIHVDEVGLRRDLDLGGLVSFIPSGCRTNGWAHLAKQLNSFTVLYFDPTIVPEESDGAVPPTDRPQLHFEDGALRSTLWKIEQLLIRKDFGDAVYAETLALLAAIEISRHQKGRTNERKAPKGALSIRQKLLISNYLHDNLHEQITLSELATLVGLSRYHFARAFAKSFGIPPHQYILRSRIARAQRAVLESKKSIADIAADVGMGSNRQFARVFRRFTGYSPSELRRKR